MTAWWPTPSDVAAHMPARLTLPNGGRADTFTDETRPTADAVTSIIASQASALRTIVGDNPTGDVADEAHRLLALLAAYVAETTYWPEQVQRGMSNAPQLLELYTAGMRVLPKAVQQEAGGGQVGVGDDPPMPRGGSGSTAALAAGAEVPCPPGPIVLDLYGTLPPGA